MNLYLVTGGAGFIGSHLVTALVQRGHRARVLDDLSTGSRDNLSHLEVGSYGSGAPVEFLEGSITESAACAEACRDAFGVFHEAAQVSVPESVRDPVRSYQINVTGTLNVLEAARAAGAERFVFASSSAIYGDGPTLPKVETMIPKPQSPYASGKAAGEHLLQVYGRVHGMRTVNLRYFNIFGPRQADDSPYTGVIAIFAKALIEGRPTTIYGDGEQTRDFTFVENVVQANLRAIEVPLEAGDSLNVGTGERISVNALFSAMAAHLGSSLRPDYAEPRPGDVKHSVASCDAARERLGYQVSVSWRDGLSETVDWYKTRLSPSKA